jgi:hypothetical protein
MEHLMYNLRRGCKEDRQVSSSWNCSDLVYQHYRRRVRKLILKRSCVIMATVVPRMLQQMKHLSRSSLCRNYSVGEYFLPKLSSHW